MIGIGGGLLLLHQRNPTFMCIMRSEPYEPNTPSGVEAPDADAAADPAVLDPAFVDDWIDGGPVDPPDVDMALIGNDHALEQTLQTSV